MENNAVSTGDKLCIDIIDIVNTMGAVMNWGTKLPKQ